MRYAAAKRCCDIRKERRIAFTSGISTFVTRMPRTLPPAACFAACSMLSISSLPNLPIVLFLSSVLASTLQYGGQLAHGPLFIGGQIFLPGLRIDHQQIERA